MISIPEGEPLKPRNSVDRLPTSLRKSTSKFAVKGDTTTYATPDPKKALFTFFADADSIRKSETGGENYQMEKVAQTYKAAYAYNSLQVQKLKTALKASRSKAETVTAVSEKVADLAESNRLLDVEIAEIQGSKRLEEEKRAKLTEVLAKFRLAGTAEVDSNTALSQQVAKLTTEKTKAESSIKYLNDRIDKLKNLFAQFDSGHINHSEAVTDLENELRREKVQRHQMEMELLGIKQSIQRQKQDLLLLKQQYDSANLAKRSALEEARETLLSAKREEEHWKEELSEHRESLDAALAQGESISAVLTQEKAALQRIKMRLSCSDFHSAKNCLVLLWVLFFVAGLALQVSPKWQSGIS